MHHRTITLFPASEVSTGKVIDVLLYSSPHHQKFLIVKQVAKAYPRIKLRLLCENYGTDSTQPSSSDCSATRGPRYTSPHPQVAGSTSWS